MKVKALLILCFIVNVNFANADQYALTFRDSNKWVAQQDIEPVRDIIKELIEKPYLSLNAVCSDKDIFCEERIKILNHILKTQKLSNIVKFSNKSKSFDKNSMIINSFVMDPNKFSSSLILYKNLDFVPQEKSKKIINSLIKKSELKYLSQFKLYCKNVNALCKKRAEYISEKIGKKLTFKYNFYVGEDSNLDNNKARLNAFRHDYEIKENITTQVEIKQNKVIQNTKKIVKKKFYSKDPFVISFQEGSSELLLSEKAKIEKLIHDYPKGKFYFVCNRKNSKICEDRVKEIKFYALEKTDALLELYQLEKDTLSNRILIQPCE